MGSPPHPPPCAQGPLPPHEPGPPPPPPGALQKEPGGGGEEGGREWEGLWLERRVLQLQCGGDEGDLSKGSWGPDPHLGALKKTPPKFKTFVSCYRTPDPGRVSEGFQKGSLKGSLKL